MLKLRFFPENQRFLNYISNNWWFWLKCGNSTEIYFWTKINWLVKFPLREYWKVCSSLRSICCKYLVSKVNCQYLWKLSICNKYFLISKKMRCTISYFLLYEKLIVISFKFLPYIFFWLKNHCSDIFRKMKDIKTEYQIICIYFKKSFLKNFILFIIIFIESTSRFEFIIRSSATLDA